MSEVNFQSWMSYYLGKAGSENMQNLINNGEVDENYFTQQGITVEGEIDEGEFKQLGLKASGLETKDDVLVDENTDELYIERDAWDDSIVDEYYDIESMTTNVVNQDMIREAIRKEILLRNDIKDGSTIKDGKLYLPNLTDATGTDAWITDLSTKVLTTSTTDTTTQDTTGNLDTNTNTNTNENKDTNVNVDASQLETSLKDSYTKNKDIDALSTMLDESGILAMDAEPKTDEAGLQAMYYAFGNDWKGVTNLIRTNSILKKDDDIDYAARLAIALKNYKDSESGYTKEGLEKAARIYYGDDIPKDFKDALGITSQDDIENKLENGAIGGDDNGNSSENVNDETDGKTDNNSTIDTKTEISDETLESIVEDIENGGTALPGTLDSEILAIKEIYPDNWKDLVKTAAGKYTDSETSEINFENGKMIEYALNKWVQDEDGQIKDDSVIEACKKYYGDSPIWDEANKENIMFLTSFMSPMNKYKQGEITKEELKNELNNAVKLLDSIENPEKGSNIAGLKALREAWGDNWSNTIADAATAKEIYNFEDNYFSTKIEDWVKKHQDDKEKIIEVCKIYYENESDYPQGVKNTLKSGDDPKESALSQDEINEKVQGLYDAFEGLGRTDEEKLSEIIMGSSKAELRDIIEAYGGAEKLIDDVKGETSSQLRKILVRAIETAAADININKNTSPVAMANDLYDATAGRAGTKHDKVYELLIDSDDEAIIEMAKYIYENKRNFDGMTLEDMIIEDFKSCKDNDMDALLEKLERLGITDSKIKDLISEEEDTEDEDK